MTVHGSLRAIGYPRYGTDEYQTRSLLTSEDPFTPPEATPDATDEDEDEDDGGDEGYFPDPYGLDLPLEPLAFLPPAGLPGDSTAADYNPPMSPCARLPLTSSLSPRQPALSGLCASRHQTAPMRQVSTVMPRSLLVLD